MTIASSRARGVLWGGALCCLLLLMVACERTVPFPASGGESELQVEELLNDHRQRRWNWG